MTALTIAAWIVGIGLLMLGISVFAIYLWIKNESKPTVPIKEEDAFAEYKKREEWKFLPENVKGKIENGILKDNQLRDIFLLPWHSYMSDNINFEKINIGEILDNLNQSHYGMTDAKKEIARYLVTLKYANKHQSSLLLNGPVGTGKTSLAISVANALGKKPIVINLNGIIAGFELVGSSPDWLNASSGAIANALIEANCFSPVIIFDEIDKCAINERHGTIWDSLLRIIDKNYTEFRENFLGISFDISKIMFIFTSNSTIEIPFPLLNRMKLVNVSGYSELEKKMILQKYVIPKLYNDYRILDSEIQIADNDIQRIINDCQYDVGVRSLTKMAENIFTDKLIERENIEGFFSISKKVFRSSSSTTITEKKQLFTEPPIKTNNIFEE